MNILKDKYTIEIVDSLLKKLNLKKELAMDLLSKIIDSGKDEYQLLAEMINKFKEIDVVNIVIRLLAKSYCFGDEINETIINNKIKEEIEIDKMLEPFMG